MNLRLIKEYETVRLSQPTGKSTAGSIAVTVTHCMEGRFNGV